MDVGVILASMSAMAASWTYYASGAHSSGARIKEEKLTPTTDVTRSPWLAEVLATDDVNKNTTSGAVPSLTGPYLKQLIALARDATSTKKSGCSGGRACYRSSQGKSKNIALKGVENLKEVERHDKELKPTKVLVNALGQHETPCKDAMEEILQSIDIKLNTMDAQKARDLLDKMTDRCCKMDPQEAIAFKDALATIASKFNSRL